MQENIVARLNGITKRYRRKSDEVLALAGIELEVRAGEIIVINGPSGSGKSTMLMVMAAMLKPTAGEYCLLGRGITKLTMRHACSLRQSTVGIVLPTLELIPYISALENVLLADFNGVGRARGIEVLETLGLKDRVNHLPNQLSTGEQRRVLVARALMNSPKLLLCDEPTSNLDNENAKLIREALIAAKGQGMAVVVVTHEVPDLFAADKVYKMQQGTLVCASLSTHG